MKGNASRQENKTIEKVFLQDYRRSLSSRDDLYIYISSPIAAPVTLGGHGDLPESRHSEDILGIANATNSSSLDLALCSLQRQRLAALKLEAWQLRPVRTPLARLKTMEARGTTTIANAFCFRFTRCQRLFAPIGLVMYI